MSLNFQLFTDFSFDELEEYDGYRDCCDGFYQCGRSAAYEQGFAQTHEQFEKLTGMAVEAEGELKWV